MISKEGIVRVTRTYVVSGETEKQTEKERAIEIRPFVTDTATVSVKIGRTINTGNYESVRMDVMIAMPCYAEEVKGVYDQVLGVVKKLAFKEEKKIRQKYGAE